MQSSVYIIHHEWTGSAKLSISSLHISHARESKTVLDSKFQAADFGFQFSLFWTSANRPLRNRGLDFRAEFRILKPRIPDSTSKNLVPDYPFIMYLGRTRYMNVELTMTLSVLISCCILTIHVVWAW